MSDDGRPRTPDADVLLAHAGWLRALARRLVHDSGLAEDLAQDTLAAAIRRPPPPETPLAPWLARVARNLSFREIRGRLRRARREALAAGPRAPLPPDESAARAEAYRNLIDAVGALDAPYREVVLLRWFDGMDVPSVASKLRVPEETVRTRLKRAHAQLRARLDRGHAGDGPAPWVLLILGTRTAAPPPGAGIPARGVPRTGPGGSTVAAATAAGGLLMGKKTVAVVAILLVAACITAWVTSGPAPDLHHARGPEATGTANLPAGSPKGAVRARSEVPEPPRTQEPASRAATARPCVTGTVVLPDGRPAREARVLVVPPADDAAEKSQPAAGTCDASGRFSIEVSPAIPEFRVAADAPGAACTIVDRVRTGAGVRVLLRPAVALTGRVTDLDGVPVAGARVRWIERIGETATVARSATSAADGAYRIEGVREPEPGDRFGDRGRLAADADGFAPFTVRWTPSDGLRQDLRMVRGATVEGRVIDGEAGTPVAGARVFAWSYERPVVGAADGLQPGGSGAFRFSETQSGADGSFRFEHVPAIGFHAVGQIASGARGNIVGGVGAIAGGYAPGADEVPHVRDGSKIDAEIRLWPAASITGRVVDRARQPLAGIEVSEFSAERKRGWIPASVADVPRSSSITGGDGRFRMDGVTALRGASASAHLYATNAALRRAMTNGAGPVDVSIRAGETSDAGDILFAPDIASVRLRVRDAAGVPVPGAAVSFDQCRTEARSGRDGVAEFLFTHNRAGIPPKPVTLVVRARGFAAAVTPSFTPGAEAPPDVDVVLAPGRRLAGRVVRADGAPAAGAEVWALTAAVPLAELRPANGLLLGVGAPPGAGKPALPILAWTNAGDDGTFSMDELPEGACVLLSWQNGSPGVATVEGVQAGSTNVVVTLPALPAPASAGSVEATLLDAATGRSVARPVAELRNDADPPPAPEAPTASGVVRWAVVPAGKWRVTVRADGFVAATTDVVVIPGETARVEVRLQRGATVRGRIVGAAGVVVRDVVIALRPDGEAEPGRYGGTGVVAADGTFEIRGVPPGRWRPDLLRPNSGETPYVVEGPAVLETGDSAAGAADVALDLRAVLGARIGIYVPAGSSQGDGGKGARVSIRAADGREVWAFSLSATATSVDATVPAGAWTCVLEIPDAVPESRPVAVEAGARAVVRFDEPGR